MCTVQAFAISVKGRVRPGRFRRDPNDVTACRYDMAPKLLKVSRSLQPLLYCTRTGWLMPEQSEYESPYILHAPQPRAQRLHPTQVKLE